jgi:hypothetical protein
MVHRHLSITRAAKETNVSDIFTVQGGVIRRWDLPGGCHRVFLAVLVDGKTKDTKDDRVIVFFDNPHDHIWLGMVEVGDKVQVEYDYKRPEGAFTDKHSYVNGEVHLRKLEVLGLV